MSNWYYEFIDSVRLKVMLCLYPLWLIKIKQLRKQIRDIFENHSVIACMLEVTVLLYLSNLGQQYRC